MEIYHIACSQASPFFATATLGGEVSVFDYASRRRVTELQTTLDFGGQRLAVSDGGLRVVAGAYQIHGVCCYELAAQTQLMWQRKDLKKVQHISISDQAGLIAAGIEGKALHLLDAASGSTTRKFSGAAECGFGSGSDGVLLLGKTKGARLVSLRSGKTIIGYRLPFPIGDAAQSDGEVLLAQGQTMELDAEQDRWVIVAPGVLWCFSREGQVLWRAAASLESHFIHLAWCAQLSLWFAIEWSSLRGGPYVLKAFDPDGRLKHNRPIGQLSEAEFLMGGRYLVTSAGHVLDLPSLAVLWDFSSLP